MPGLSIDGVSSGLDTTKIIDAIIAFERRPAVLMEQDQAERTNIISTLKALEAKFLALKTQAARLTRRVTYNQSQINVSDDTVLTATSSGRVSTGSYDIQVLSLARNHQLATQGFSDEALAAFGTGTITLGVGNTSPKTITIDSTNNSLVGIKQAINDANAGVTATIINDGSKANSYRLVLSADETGFANTISFTSSLTGGNSLNVSTASFDQPEEILFDSSSDAQVSLGASAAYTGSENKAYTFTVAGSGAQTVGVDNITIDWTDGTNSGSIVVTQADTEVDLVGTGADGLKLSFSVGQLTAGDTFQVQTFAPLLQSASDAKIAVGSSGGTGSPITVTSSSNTLTQIIPSVTLQLRKETLPGDHVTVSTEPDVQGLRQAVNDFISAYNDVNKFVDKQNSYNETTKEAGILLGDSIVQTMQYSMRSVIADRISGLNSKYNQLFAIGIRTDAKGKLSIKDSSLLEEALKNNLDDVVNLFSDAGTTSSNLIEFISASAASKVGDNYEVDITQAATQGTYKGTTITDPASSPITLTSANNRLKLTVSGLTSEELILSEKTYNSTDELVKEVQNRIDADPNISKRGLTVQWVSSGTGIGYLEFTASTYGSGSSVGINTSLANGAAVVLGLAGGVGADGQDVQGTINGEDADGQGQLLTGKSGNDTTDGLKLKITLDPSQVVSGIEGTVSLTKGIASKLDDLLDSLTKTGDGLLSRRISTYEKQVDDLKSRVAAFDERLTMRRERLQLQFQRMEEILGQLNAQGQFLSSQLANINVNWQAK